MRRQGFTLVEMLVAMALTLFVMVILSQAFIAALDTFRALKAIGDMDEGLRTAVNNLRADLQLDHFEAKRRLSDPSLTSPAIREGFFVIRQDGATIIEGTDADGLPSKIAANHVLHFSVKARGNRQENFFAAAVPSGSPLLTNPTNFFGQPGDSLYQAANTFTSPWAEVAYFLVDQGTTTEPNNPAAAGGTKLHKLYRSQFVVVPRNTELGGKVLSADQGSYNNVSFSIDPTDNTKLYFNTPTDLAAGTRRFSKAKPTATIIDASNATPINIRAPNHGCTTGQKVTISGVLGNTAANGTWTITIIDANNFTLNGSTGNGNYTSGGTAALYLATLMLNSVVSFSVQAMKPADSDFGDLGGTYPAVYDTNSPSAYPLSALEITIRVWDLKTQQSRQITMVQDL